MVENRTNHPACAGLAVLEIAPDSRQKAQLLVVQPVEQTAAIYRQAAREARYPCFAQGMLENNRQRGKCLLLSRPAFEAQVPPGPALEVGSPAELIKKLPACPEFQGLNRALIQLEFGGMPEQERLAAIERLGAEVAPVCGGRSRRERAAGGGRQREPEPADHDDGLADVILETLGKLLPFQALTLPVAIFASSGDFDGTVLLNPRVHGRIQIAFESAGRYLPVPK
ncbi:hypothetical protein DMP23_42145 [Amycolatopsis sp. A1MSW2902]